MNRGFVSPEWHHAADYNSIQNIYEHIFFFSYAFVHVRISAT